MYAAFQTEQLIVSATQAAVSAAMIAMASSDVANRISNTLMRTGSYLSRAASTMIGVSVLPTAVASPTPNPALHTHESEVGKKISHAILYGDIIQPQSSLHILMKQLKNQAQNNANDPVKSKTTKKLIKYLKTLTKPMRPGLKKPFLVITQYNNHHTLILVNPKKHTVIHFNANYFASVEADSAGKVVISKVTLSKTAFELFRKNIKPNDEFKKSYDGDFDTHIAQWKTGGHIQKTSRTKTVTRQSGANCGWWCFRIVYEYMFDTKQTEKLEENLVTQFTELSPKQAQHQMKQLKESRWLISTDEVLTDHHLGQYDMAQLSQILLYAASVNKSKAVNTLLHKGANINMQDASGYSPIAIASSYGYINVVKRLLKKGADLDLADFVGVTPLIKALEKGHQELAKLLVNSGADVNKKDHQENTPLMAAVQKGYIEIADLLLQKRANPNTQNKQGSTPLRITVQRGHMPLVTLLLQNGASPNMQTRQKDTPLLKAVVRANQDVANALLTNVKDPADPNKADSNGNTPLLTAIHQNNSDLARLLLEKNADLNKADNYGNTPLLTAIHKNNLDLVKLLLEKNADLNKADSNGNTPLLVALHKNDLALVQLFLDKGADPDREDKFGKTPLLQALLKMNKKSIELLLKYGANRNHVLKVKGKSGKFVYSGVTVSQIAKARNRSDIVKVLESSSPPTDVFPNPSFDITKNNGLVNAMLYGIQVDPQQSDPVLIKALEKTLRKLTKTLKSKGKKLGEKGRKLKEVIRLLKGLQNQDKITKGHSYLANTGGDTHAALLWVKPTENTVVYVDTEAIRPGELEEGASIDRLSTLKVEIQTVTFKIEAFKKFEKGIQVDSGRRSYEENFATLMTQNDMKVSPYTMVSPQWGTNCGWWSRRVLLESIMGRKWVKTFETSLVMKSITKVQSAMTDALSTSDQKKWMNEIKKSRLNIMLSIFPILDATNKHLSQKDISRLLPIAATIRNKPAVEELLKKGANPNELDIVSNALVNAACFGHREIVELLLAGGAVPDIANEKGATALQVASEYGHKEIVGLLLAEDAIPNIQDKKGTTALQAASHSGHKEIVGLLLAGGAIPNIQDKEGFTALSRASHNGHKKIVGLLLAGGADHHIQDERGITALSHASHQGHKDNVELLLAGGADPNIQNEEGFTALHTASSHGHKEIVGLLLEGLAVPDTQDKQGFTALSCAMHYGQTGIVKLLLEKGANPNAIDDKGNTPLFNALFGKNMKIVTLLLQNKANPYDKLTIQNPTNPEGPPAISGKTVIQIAEAYGLSEMLEVLESSPPPTEKNKKTCAQKKKRRNRKKKAKNKANKVSTVMHKTETPSRA